MSVMLLVENRGSGCVQYPLLPDRMKLAGVIFDYGVHSTQGNIETLTLGDFGPADLVQEPDNPHDPCAIRVVWRGEFHLGYIPREFSGILSQILEQGRRFQACNLKRHEHPLHETLGVSVEIKEVE